jgi:hypothetical protein
MAISVSIGVPIAGDVVQFSRFENRGEVREVLEGVEPQHADARYSDFVIYVDESGDHGMQRLDPYIRFSYSPFVCFISATIAKRSSQPFRSSSSITWDMI